MRDDGVCSFLFVGHIMKEKGVDEFFTAAKTVKAEFGEKVAFDVVGFYEDALKKPSIIWSLTESSTSTAFRRMCIHSMKRRTVLCCPPTMRVCPTSCWRVPPLVAPHASDIPGCREAVEDGVSGYICPAKDADTLYDTMQCFVEFPESWRAEMGAEDESGWKSDSVRMRLLRRQ